MELGGRLELGVLSGPTVMGEGDKHLFETLLSTYKPKRKNLSEVLSFYDLLVT